LKPEHKVYCHEGRQKKFLVFGKSLVEQGDNLALEIGSSVDDEKTLAAKFTQSDDIFRRNYEFYNNGQKECLRRRLARQWCRFWSDGRHGVQGVILQRINYVNILPVLAQVGVKRQPVMPCRFHAEFCGRVEFSNCVHEFEKTCVRIDKTNPFNDNLARLIDYGGFVNYSDSCGSKPV